MHQVAAGAQARGQEQAAQTTQATQNKEGRRQQGVQCDLQDGKTREAQTCKLPQEEAKEDVSKRNELPLFLHLPPAPPSVLSFLSISAESHQERQI